uniref:Putative secreted protein n=1 Tax=Ixodes ricinus TaxID=34613 RepID=A0A6B0UPT5_IXORI
MMVRRWQPGPLILDLSLIAFCTPSTTAKRFHRRRKNKVTPPKQACRWRSSDSALITFLRVTDIRRSPHKPRQKQPPDQLHVFSVKRSISRERHTPTVLAAPHTGRGIVKKNKGVSALLSVGLLV